MAARLAMLLALVLLLAVVAPSQCEEYIAGFEVSDVEAKADHSSKRCDVDFSKVSYHEVTSVCKGPQYDQAQCCAAFDKVACKYKQNVNDFSSTCPIEFMAYLNYAGSYPNGVFVGRCNSGNALCSA